MNQRKEGFYNNQITTKGVLSCSFQYICGGLSQVFDPHMNEQRWGGNTGSISG